MFNEGQKLEYLKDAVTINQQLEQVMVPIFTQLELMETEKDKDVAEWTAGEIIEYYKSTATSSLNTLNTMHSQLRKYAAWCLDRNLLPDSQNHFTEIDIDILGRCINVGLQSGGILTRKQMEMIITQLLNPRDQCLVYALFEGICGKQFCELVDLNVSQLEGNTLHLPTRSIPISDKLVELMKQCTEEYTYYAYGSHQKTYQYDPSDTNVFKNAPNAISSALIRKRQRLYTNLSRIKNQLDDSAINTTSLLESGRIDMIKGLRKEGDDIEDTISKNREAIENKYGKIYNVNAYLITYQKYFEE